MSGLLNEKQEVEKIKNEFRSFINGEEKDDTKNKKDEKKELILETC